MSYTRLSKIGFLMLLAATLSLGQSTSVTLQVTDTDGQSWNNGTWSATLTSNASSGPFAILGTSTPVPNQSQSGALGATGGAIMTLTPNASIGPIGTQWAFQVCPKANPAACYAFKATIQGASQNLTLTPPGIRISVVNPVILVSAYQDLEIFGQAISSTYYNLVSSVTRQWNGSSWVTLGGGGSTGGTIRVCDTSTQAGTDLGARIIACDAVLGGTRNPSVNGSEGAYNQTPTYGTIRVNSSDVGPISTTPVFISSGHTLSLGPGVYTNALGEYQPPIMLGDNSTLQCDGWGTILQNSSNAADTENVVVGMANAYIPNAGPNWTDNQASSTTTGVTVKNCHFADSGLLQGTSLTGTVALTNCHECKAINNWIDNIRTTAISLVGRFDVTSANCPSAHPTWCSNFGTDDELAGNVITGASNAGISVINNDNVSLHHNIFRNHAAGAAAYIDMESNTSYDHMQYIDVGHNLMDCSAPVVNAGCNGLTMNSAGLLVGHIKIHDNILWGPLQGTALSGQTEGGLGSGTFNLHSSVDVEIYNNQVANISGNGIGLAGVDHGWVHDNYIECAGSGAITISPDAQYSVIEHNTIRAPVLATFTVTSVSTAVAGSATYTGTFTGGGSNAFAFQRFYVTGFTNAGNNGNFGATTSTATTITVLNPGAVAETHAATAQTGCLSVNTTGREPQLTMIRETDSTDNFNIYRDNIGAGETILFGANSVIVNTQAAGQSTEGTTQTFDVPTGFGASILGDISISQLSAPVLYTPGASFGSVPACNLSGPTTYFWIITAVSQTGAEVPSNEISQLAGGGNGCPVLGWNYIAGASSYKIYRSTSSGTEVFLNGAVIPQGTIAYRDNGGQTTGGAVPTVNATGAIQFGSLTFAKLPSSPNGTVYYCSDCKNVTDDTTGTFDSAAASGGHGTLVLRENGAWRVH